MGFEVRGGESTRRIWIWITRNLKLRFSNSKKGNKEHIQPIAVPFSYQDRLISTCFRTFLSRWTVPLTDNKYMPEGEVFCPPRPDRLLFPAV